MNLCELLKKIAAILFPPGNEWFYLPGQIFFIAMIIIWVDILPFGLAAYVGYCYVSGVCWPNVEYFPYSSLVGILVNAGEAIIKLTVPFFIFSLIFDVHYLLKEKGVLK